MGIYRIVGLPDWGIYRNGIYRIGRANPWGGGEWVAKFIGSAIVAMAAAIVTIANVEIAAIIEPQQTSS